jgi:transglutaminase superfamily protein
MTRTIPSLLCRFILILSIIFPSFYAGCIDFNDVGDFFDPVLRRAEPYINEIVYDDASLRNYALSIIQESNSTDKEQIVNMVYRYIVENFQYISDPKNEELIRSPMQTINIKGGDCEDLSILLISLLENLGIKTFLVLTDEHAYALAYDINIGNLWKYVEQSLLEQVEKDSGEDIWQQYQQTFVLKKQQIWYYGGEGNSINESDSFDYINFTYSVDPQRPIDFYVVPKKQDFYNYSDDLPFNYYENHYGTKTKSILGTCGYMYSFGGIMLSNPNWLDTKVTVNLSFYSHPSFYKLFENNTIRSYTIKEKKCIVLEPTAGAYGYPGFDANVTGKKTAIDLDTKEYVYLE